MQIKLSGCRLQICLRCIMNIFGYESTVWPFKLQGFLYFSQIFCHTFGALHLEKSSNNANIQDKFEAEKYSYPPFQDQKCSQYNTHIGGKCNLYEEIITFLDFFSNLKIICLFDGTYQIFCWAAPNMTFSVVFTKNFFLSVHCIIEHNRNKSINKNGKSSKITNFAGMPYHKQGGKSIKYLHPAEASPTQIISSPI